MRISLPLLVCLVAAPAFAAGANLDGNWILDSDIYGSTLHEKMVLKIDGDKLSGQVSDDKIEGTRRGDTLTFFVKNAQARCDYTLTVAGDRLTGEYVQVEVGSDSPPVRGSLSARRAPSRPPGPPRHHDFVPTSFSREFTAARAPVLTIWPGDSVHTSTVDAGGTDAAGVTRVLGGNPETGPFYVEGAMPGDVLAVKLTRLRLNRDYAVSDDFVVRRALDPDLAVKMKDGGKSIRWSLDRKNMTGAPAKASDHLKKFSVPLRPMLGCVAVAPGFGAAPIIAGDSGSFGGNMDFNGIVEGTTVFLPVNQPGALLYVGDGHAAQGDGELTGNALETSMDVDFTVEVVHDKHLNGPRVESPLQVMTVGLGGSIEEALRSAVASMSEWLEQDYALTPSEVAQVLGSALELSINEVADRNAGVVARLAKARLATLPRKPAK